MSGSFEALDVPPTLVSFAVTMGKADEVVSPEFKKAGNKVYLIAPEYDETGLPKTESLLSVFDKVTALQREGKVVASYTPGLGGVGEAVMKMCFGNGLGFTYADGWCPVCAFKYNYGAFVVEATEEIDGARLVGTVTEEKAIALGDEKICLDSLLGIYEDKLESVYSCNITAQGKNYFD